MARQTIDVDQIINEARELTKLRQEIGPKLNKARQVLTFLEESGLLSEEQSATVNELFSQAQRVKGVRLMDTRTKKQLDRPVYSKAMGAELEGQLVTDEDMGALFGEDWRTKFPNAGEDPAFTEA